MEEGGKGRKRQEAGWSGCKISMNPSNNLEMEKERGEEEVWELEQKQKKRSSKGKCGFHFEFLFPSDYGRQKKPPGSPRPTQLRSPATSKQSAAEARGSTCFPRTEDRPEGRSSLHPQAA